MKLEAIKWTNALKELINEINLQSVARLQKPAMLLSWYPKDAVKFV